jgi:hypothetical protein
MAAGRWKERRFLSVEALGNGRELVTQIHARPCNDKLVAGGEMIEPIAQGGDRRAARSIDARQLGHRYSPSARCRGNRSGLVAIYRVERARKS